MNKNQFQKSIHNTINSYDINLRLITSWYQEIVNSLKIIKSKARNIKHPRHLGDFLEDEVSKIIKDLMPQRYDISKGFVLNDFSGISQEQDLLIIDRNLGSPICKTDQVGYYPIESIISSIEVKSNLNLSELRKCLVSCASLKKLSFPAFEYDDIEEKRVFYGIFAYTSSCKASSFEKELTNSIKSIPESLRPNMIYILDQGLYFPTKENCIYLDLETIQTTQEDYKIIPNSANVTTESQNFILFFSNLIDHAFHQSNIRKPTKYTSYVINPTVWEDKIKETRDSDVPVKKFINRYTQWSEKHNGVLLTIFEESCPNCSIEYKFYRLPPGTKEMRANLEKELREKKCLPLPINNKHTCDCGEILTMKEAE